MLGPIRKFFSDRFGPNAHCMRSNSVKKKPDGHYSALKMTPQFSKKDLLLDNSFTHPPKFLPPKFDSIADQLMDQFSTSPKQNCSDDQQLFLKSSRNCIPLQEKEPFGIHEIIQQLRQLSNLLNSILSEYTLNGNYSSSFLREIIHNICLDLNVVLLNLDNQVKTESCQEVALKKRGYFKE
jgi:hypothetical protein